jgi:hypothetical protein
VSDDTFPYDLCEFTCDFPASAQFPKPYPTSQNTSYPAQILQTFGRAPESVQFPLRYSSSSSIMSPGFSKPASPGVLSGLEESDVITLAQPTTTEYSTTEHSGGNLLISSPTVAIAHLTTEHSNDELQIALQHGPNNNITLPSQDRNQTYIESETSARTDQQSRKSSRQDHYM